MITLQNELFLNKHFKLDTLSISVNKSQIQSNLLFLVCNYIYVNNLVDSVGT